MAETDREADEFLKTIVRRFLLVFVENPWHWVGLLVYIYGGAWASLWLAELTGVGFHFIFFGGMIMGHLFMPRMTVEGREIGVPTVGWAYRRLRRVREDPFPVIEKSRQDFAPGTLPLA